jgi:5-methylcytosine-specific restriction endonuclease McrA
MLTSERVLVLNASYEPVHICGVKRALVMVFTGTARVEEADAGRFLRSPSRAFPLPLVIRLQRYVRIPRREFNFSKKNIFLRDGYTCQYCGVMFASRDLTLDHVTPRSGGGDSSWENLVTCCKPCNHRKGNRRPEDAGLRLLRHPRPQTPQSYLYYLHAKGVGEEKWKKYFFYEYRHNEWMWRDDSSFPNPS